MKIYPKKCPRKFTFYLHEKSATLKKWNKQTQIDKLLYRYLPYDTIHNQVGQMRKQKQNYNVCVQWKEHDTKIFCNFNNVMIHV